MKINGYNPVSGAAATRKAANAASAGSFAELLSASESSETPHTSAMGDIAAASLNNLLLLQEISEEDIHRRKLVQQGNNMLDALENLRRQLLSGSLPPQTIRELSRQITIQKQLTADPALSELIEDIELRAAVELAKLETAMNRPQSNL